MISKPRPRGVARFGIGPVIELLVSEANHGQEITLFEMVVKFNSPGNCSLPRALKGAVGSEKSTR